MEGLRLRKLGSRDLSFSGSMTIDLKSFTNDVAWREGYPGIAGFEFRASNFGAHEEFMNLWNLEGFYLNGEQLFGKENLLFEILDSYHEDAPT